MTIDLGADDENERRKLLERYDAKSAEFFRTEARQLRYVLAAIVNSLGGEVRIQPLAVEAHLEFHTHTDQATGDLILRVEAPSSRGVAK